MHPEYEDYYFNIEKIIIARVGMEIGGKMHTARSRNDLGSTMLRMNVRDTLMKIIPMVYELEKVLLHMAEENKDKLLKDYPFWATDVIAGGTYDCVPDDLKPVE